MHHYTTFQWWSVLPTHRIVSLAEPRNRCETIVLRLCVYVCVYVCLSAMTFSGIALFSILISKRFDVPTYLSCHDELIVVTNFYTSWHIFDVITHFWHHDIFWRYNFLMSWGAFLTSWRIFDVMRRIFNVMTYFWHKTTFDIMKYFYLPRRRWPGTGDIATPPVHPSVCLSVCPSVCLSVTFSFRTVTKKRIDVFSRNFAGMCTMSWGCAV